MHAAIYRRDLKKSMIDHALSKVRDRIAPLPIIISVDTDTLRESYRIAQYVLNLCTMFIFVDRVIYRPVLIKPPLSFFYWS